MTAAPSSLGLATAIIPRFIFIYVATLRHGLPIELPAWNVEDTSLAGIRCEVAFDWMANRTSPLISRGTPTLPLGNSRKKPAVDNNGDPRERMPTTTTTVPPVKACIAAKIHIRTYGRKRPRNLHGSRSAKERPVASGLGAFTKTQQIIWLFAVCFGFQVLVAVLAHSDDHGDGPRANRHEEFPLPGLYASNRLGLRYLPPTAIAVCPANVLNPLVSVIAVSFVNTGYLMLILGSFLLTLTRTHDIIVIVPLAPTDLHRRLQPSRKER